MAAAVGAAVAPAMLAYNLPPSATFFNQAAALIGWGLVAAMAAVCIGLNVGHGGALPAVQRYDRSGLTCLTIALFIVAASAAASTLFGSLPASLSLSAIGMIAAVMVIIWAGASARRAGLGPALFRAVCIAMIAAGLVCVLIACVQVFFPSLSDGTLVARSLPGRASGNVRQPNHLASLMVWSCIAAVWLYEAQLIKRTLASMLMLLFVYTVALSLSRTGVLELAALALWGAFDRRLSRSARLMLVLVPVMYIVSWLGMAEWAKLGSQVYVGAERLQQQDVSSSRFAIWSNALELIKRNPWLGTGFGEFNLAWTMSPFPTRPTEFFDHPHNLVLHLLSELGVPLGALVTALLCSALWRVFAASRQGEPPLQATTRAAFMMIVTIAVHSMLEYPLWYAYFLLPAGLLFGLALGATPATSASAESILTTSKSTPASLQVHGAASFAAGVGNGATTLMAASVLLILASVASLFDYNRVVVIFAPPADAGPLMARIDSGEKSVFFSHHASYAMATTEQDPPAELSDFKPPVHYLLDTRLMMAWAEAYARAGDLQRASYIAQRLREFRSGDTAAFFEPCDESKKLASTATPEPAKAPKKGRVVASLPNQKPFQCVAPTESLTWRDFR